MGKGTGKIEKPEAAKTEGGAKPEASKGGPPAQHGGGAPAHGGGKSNVGAKVGCHAQGCKGKDVRFNFCEEHFRQFKFGLIKKTGEMVSDYERKFEHYQEWLKAQGERQSA